MFGNLLVKITQKQPVTLWSDVLNNIASTTNGGKSHFTAKS